MTPLPLELFGKATVETFDSGDGRRPRGTKARGQRVYGAKRVVIAIGFPDDLNGGSVLGGTVFKFRVATFSALAVSLGTFAALPPKGVPATGCVAGLAGVADSVPPMLSPAGAQIAWDRITGSVRLDAANLQKANPTRPPHELYDQALANGRRGLTDPAALQAFDAYVHQMQVGRQEFEGDVRIFKDPVSHLGKPKLTAAETDELTRRAYEFLVKGGDRTANMAHIADHLATLAKIEPQLRAAGIDPAEVRLAMMIHDLGKEFDQLPASYRTFLQSQFPDGKDFLGQQILPHEFASMAVIERLGQQMGLSREKIDRLKASIAHHNAGYDPLLPGFHFWVQPFAWSAFAMAMNRRLAEGLPEFYAAVPATDAGGDAATVILTAIDRATSLTLASQEKFAATWVAQGHWSNEQLAEQVHLNALNVANEMTNVLGKLAPSKDMPAASVTAVRNAVTEAFSQHLTQLKKLAADLPQMALGRGDFADGAKLVHDLPATATVYRTKTGVWHRVDADGTYYVANAAKTEWVPKQAGSPEMKGADIAGRLFRNAIFPDYGYTPNYVGDFAPPPR